VLKQVEQSNGKLLDLPLVFCGGLDPSDDTTKTHVRLMLLTLAELDREPASCSNKRTDRGLVETKHI